MAAVDNAIGKFPRDNGGIWQLQLRGNIYLEFCILYHEFITRQLIVSWSGRHGFSE